MKVEEKNRKLGLAISAGIHVALLLLFLFIIAWREPDPPLPEYGIELNFGMDNVGSGNVQPETPVEETNNDEEAAPEELPEESTEEIVEEVEPTPEVVETSPEASQTTENTQESPDVIEETKPVEQKPVIKEEKEVEKPTQKPVENTKPENPNSGAKGQDGENTEVQNANQGDNADEQGDKGDEQGTLDSRALYGQAGGGGGSSLEMTGWVWDFKPRPNDTSNENGRIVFEIKIDDQGEIISVRTIERSVSPAIEKIYRNEVEKLTFSKTSDNSIVAPMSTGRITFVIKSK